MKYLPLIGALLMFSCKDEPTPHPDVNKHLVVNIPLNGTAFDSISSSTGNIFAAVPALNRHQEIGKAMEFSRVDSAFIDFGDLAGASFPDNKFTICCWIKITDTLSPASVLSKRGAFGPWEYSIDNHFSKEHFNFDNWISDGSETVYGVDPLEASVSFHLNSWQHIAYVANGTTLNVFLNGNLQTGSDHHQIGSYFSDTNGNLVIGDGGGYDKHYLFNGCIDDIRMYNVPLEHEVIAYLASL